MVIRIADAAFGLDSAEVGDVLVVILLYLSIYIPVYSTQESEDIIDTGVWQCKHTRVFVVRLVHSSPRGYISVQRLAKEECILK